MAQYKAKTANTIEELNELIDNRWTVISIKGEAFELLSDKVYEMARQQSKSKKFNKGAKIFTGIAGVASLFVPGAILPLYALAAAAAGGGAVGLTKKPINILTKTNMMTKKELRKYFNYGVEKIDEDNKEIVLINSRYNFKKDTYIYEEPMETISETVDNKD